MRREHAREHLGRVLCTLVALFGGMPEGVLGAPPELISHPHWSQTRTANGYSNEAILSTDGQSMLFLSRSNEIVQDVVDSNNAADVFYFDRATQVTSLISRSAESALVPGSAESFPNSISADTRWVLFASDATNLVSGQSTSGSATNVYLHDRDNGENILVTGAGGSPTVTANGQSIAAGMSADGRWVLYYSAATNLVAGLTDNNGIYDVFLFDRLANSSLLVSRSLGSPFATANEISVAVSISADGSSVLFYSDATDLAAGIVDSNYSFDLFLFDVPTQATMLISRAAGLSASANGGTGQSDSRQPISANGRWVVFSSLATNLIAGQLDRNQSHDTFLFDKTTGVVALLSGALGSPTTTANGASYPPAISADGRKILLGSTANNLIAGVTDANDTFDAFIYDRLSMTMTLVSRSFDSLSTTANHETKPEALSSNGNQILFVSLATNLVSGVVDGNNMTDVFHFDVGAGTTSLLSGQLGSGTVTANGGSRAHQFSANGQRVAMVSSATNVVAGVSDVNGTVADVFLVQPGPFEFRDGFE